MSKQCFKITIRHDSTAGYTAQNVIYCVQNNSFDYRYFYDEKGDHVDCFGPDDFCEFLGYALQLKNHIKLMTDDDWWGCKVEEISYTDLPENIKNNN